MATALPTVDIQEPGTDLARKTVFIKLHLGLLGNNRKVSSSQVEVDADKELIRVAKTLLHSPELQAIRTLDGDVRRYLYDCPCQKLDRPQRATNSQGCQKV